MCTKIVFSNQTNLSKCIDKVQNTRLKTLALPRVRTNSDIIKIGY